MRKYGTATVARVDVENQKIAPQEHTLILTLAHVKRYVILCLAVFYSIEAAFSSAIFGFYSMWAAS